VLFVFVDQGQLQKGTAVPGVPGENDNLGLVEQRRIEAITLHRVEFVHLKPSLVEMNRVTKGLTLGIKFGFRYSSLLSLDSDHGSTWGFGYRRCAGSWEDLLKGRLAVPIDDKTLVVAACESHQCGAVLKRAAVVKGKVLVLPSSSRAGPWSYLNDVGSPFERRFWLSVRVSTNWLGVIVRMNTDRLGYEVIPSMSQGIVDFADFANIATFLGKNYATGLKNIPAPAILLNSSGVLQYEDETHFSFESGGPSDKVGIFSEILLTPDKAAVLKRLVEEVTKAAGVDLDTLWGWHGGKDESGILGQTLYLELTDVLRGVMPPEIWSGCGVTVRWLLLTRPEDALKIVQEALEAMLGRPVVIDKAVSSDLLVLPCLKRSAGHFVTELSASDPARQSLVSEVGSGEKNVGWFDCVEVRLQVGMPGTMRVQLIGLDELGTLAEFKVCVAYVVAGKRITWMTTDLNVKDARPLFETMIGWKRPLGLAESWAEVPQAAKRFVAFLETQLGVPIERVSCSHDTSKFLTRKRF
jgi:hypothetical protein